MIPLLEMQHVGKQFGDLSVLNDISLTVNKGDVLAIIGPSGSGKSTLLRIATMLETASYGSVVYNGEIEIVNASKKEKNEARKYFGLVFQNFNLFPHRSVLQNVMDAPVRVLGMSKPEAEELAMELLGKMGLADKADAYPQQLSGGQQQRVSIARALALKPEILFFDEPTSALDPELTGEILKVIRELAEEHMTMVIVTHEMNFARNVADHIVFMDHGFVAIEGKPEEVFESDNPRIKEFLGKLAD